MAFELPALPYAYNELEPAIDAQTVEIHYSKHHATYLKNLNSALENTPNSIQNLSPRSCPLWQVCLRTSGLP